MTSDGEGGSEVNTAATSYKQARILFDESHNMVQQSPALSKHFKKRKNDLYFPSAMSKMQPVSRNSDGLDGLNSQLVIMDELHAVRDRGLYEVLKQSQSTRRQPLLIMITTAGTTRQNIFDEMYEYSVKVADNIIVDNAFLPILYELDNREEWTNPAAWVKANPSLGAIKKVDDLTAKVERAKSEPHELPGLLCKEFNLKQNIKAAWLSYDDIKNTSTFELEHFRGSYFIGGVDLSQTTDLTCASILLMKKDSDEKFIHQMYWLPADNLQERVQQDKIPYDIWYNRGLLRLCSGNTINPSDVTAWFVEVVRGYDLIPAWVYYDSWGSRYFVEEMQSSGFDMQRCIQGYKTLSLPMQQLGADLKAKRVNYNNSPVLMWCLSNTGTRSDPNGNIAPIKSQSAKQRIDGTAALLNSYVGLHEHYSEFVGVL